MPETQERDRYIVTDNKEGSNNLSAATLILLSLLIVLAAALVTIYFVLREPKSPAPVIEHNTTVPAPLPLTTPQQSPSGSMPGGPIEIAPSNPSPTVPDGTVVPPAQPVQPEDQTDLTVPAVPSR